MRYKLAFDRYLKEQGYSDIRTLVAFSGSVQDAGLEYSEAQMNGGISETALREEFAKPDYHILIVVNKYQTGFDQPLLHTMYVDKRLAGVQAVQTLSRLNRTGPGKEDTFVLDFVNAAEEIQKSFQPYYEQTTIAECADPANLDQLKHELDAMQVYWQSEVEAFAQVFYKPKAQQRESDNAAFYRHISPAVERFTNNLSGEEQDTFRDKLGAYVRLYAFFSQIMLYSDADLEKLYTFGRFLLLRLPRHQDERLLAFDDEVIPNRHKFAC